MKKFALTFIVAFLAFSGTCLAQEFKVPENYSLKYSIDYAPYEKTVIQCMDWLENTPLTQDEAKHKAALSFLFKWINGAPNVHVEISSDMMDLKNEKNFPMLVIYMGGWARYELKNGDKSNPQAACLAGLRTMMKVYQKGEGVKKDKKIEALIKKDAGGQLDAWVTNMLANFNKN